MKLLLVLIAVSAVQARLQPLRANSRQLAPSPGDVTAQTSEGNVLNSGVDTFIDGLLKEWNSAGGVAVAVVQGNKTGTWNVETKGYGVAKADGTKITADTLFSLGSNSKLFDVIAAGLLVANGSLSLKTKVRSVIPEWELMDPVATNETTIVDMMSHRTGLPRHDMMYGQQETIASALPKLKYLKTSAGFRETFQYNNIVYTILSELPDRLLQIPFARYVKANVLDPLGLKSTTYSYDVAKATGLLADGFGRDGVNKSVDPFAGGTPRALEFSGSDLPGGEDGSFISGPGGVISSAKDTVRIVRNDTCDLKLTPHTIGYMDSNPTIKRREPMNTSVIPAQVLQIAATGYSVEAAELSPVVYGGGQFRGTYRGHEFIEHAGDVKGFHTQIARFPSDNLGVSVLSNDDEFGPYISLIIKYRLFDQALGLDPIDWDGRIKALLTGSNAQSLARQIPRPAQPTLPSVSLESLAGNYTNGGYGNIELCLSANQSATCKSAIEDAPTTLPGAMDSAGQTFLVKWDKFSATHLRLRHFDGNLFNASLLDSRPILNATNTFWTAKISEGPLTAEFSTDGKGFRLTGGLWGAGSGVGEPAGQTVQEKSEVWFDMGTTVTTLAGALNGASGGHQGMFGIASLVVAGVWALISLGL